MRKATGARVFASCLELWATGAMPAHSILLSVSALHLGTRCPIRRSLTPGWLWAEEYARTCPSLSPSRGSFPPACSRHCPSSLDRSKVRLQHVTAPAPMPAPCGRSEARLWCLTVLASEPLFLSCGLSEVPSACPQCSPPPSSSPVPRPRCWDPRTPESSHRSPSSSVCPPAHL